MSFFKSDKLPSCASCSYANTYIPIWNFRFSDPYCEKGHGKCTVNKICSDYKPLTICFHCIYFEKNYCKKIGCGVHWNNYVCDNFVEKEVLG